MTEMVRSSLVEVFYHDMLHSNVLNRQDDYFFQTKTRVNGWTSDILFI